MTGVIMLLGFLSSQLSTGALSPDDDGEARFTQVCDTHPQVKRLISQVQLRSAQCLKIKNELARMQSLLRELSTGAKHVCVSETQDHDGLRCREIYDRRERAAKQVREISTQHQQCVSNHSRTMRQMKELIQQLLQEGPRCQKAQN
jgi:hypothetical protein